MKLNTDWRVILRHYSSVALSIISIFSTAWAASPDLQLLVPPKIAISINLFLAIAGFVGKFIKQDLPLTLPKAPGPKNG